MDDAARFDTSFTDPISRVYESHLVPLIFEPYATLLAGTVATMPVSRVLEIAAGTGVVTRALASLLPHSVRIVATDLNAAMLAQAERMGTARSIEWRQADAMRLPFPEREFDAVLCQFGVMFFPDKVHAFSETRRVLRDGGVFMFSVWDCLEENEFAQTVTDALATVFRDPPRFMSRTPHGYYNPETIVNDLAHAGFVEAPSIKFVAARSRAPSAAVAAMAYCHGTPLRSMLEARGATALAEATDAATAALTMRFGAGPIDGKVQALTVLVSC